VVLIIEDLQWLDPSSWSLLSSFIVPGVLLVATARPSPNLLSYQRFLSRSDCVKIELHALDLHETSQMLSLLFNAVEVSEEVTQMIYQRANGNPFFTEELALSMEQKGSLVMTSGTLVLKQQKLSKPDSPAETTPEEGDGGESALPDSVQSVIMMRIDSLPYMQQVILKVAAVIARQCKAELLHAALPHELQSSITVSDIVQHLQALEAQEFLMRDKDATDVYTFKHSLIREVVYNTILSGQRRLIHARVANWYNSTYHTKEERIPIYPELAYHYQEAGDKQNAIHYYEKAAQRAMKVNAMKEASLFYEKACQLLVQIDSPREELDRSSLRRLIHWRAQLGIALNMTGDITRAEQMFKEYLSLTGMRIPDTKRGGMCAAAKESVKQLFHQMLPRSVYAKNKISTEKSRDLTEMSYVLVHLAKAKWSSLDYYGVIYCTLKAINIAETMPSPPPTLAMAQALFAYSANTLFGKKIAERYLRKAEISVKKTEDILAPLLLREILVLQKVERSQYDTALCECLTAMAECQQLSLKRLEAEFSTIAGQIALYKGDLYFLLTRAADTNKIASSLCDEQLQTWSLLLRSQALLFMCRNAEAVELLTEQHRKTGAFQRDKSLKLFASAQLGLARAIEGDSTEAELFLDEAVTISHGSFVMAFHQYPGYCDVVLGWYILSKKLYPSESMRLNILEKIQQLVRILFLYYRRFPHGRRAYLIWLGHCLNMEGHPKKAENVWRKALNLCEVEGVNLDKAQCLLALGEAERNESMLTMAIDIFERCGAKLMVKLAHDALYRTKLRSPSPYSSS